jgi:hypothetical protein
MYRQSPILRGIDRWWTRYMGLMVHAIFVCVAVLVFAVPIGAQHDGVIYEKVREQERHIDTTDQTVKDQKAELQNQINDMRKVVDDNHETLDEYKYVFGAISGFLTLVNLLGFRMQFFRGKESNG